LIPVRHNKFSKKSTGNYFLSTVSCKLATQSD
jgi:hypothetical protein